ncbi:restriction endonuclease subunit S [Acinetobacter johnsonii]|jgi:type I restriction enzyme S subunit|uniref:restriction endonuclease subunit S n=1 Tax=Acinetobacter johnsonii TaxID=40214 RepID=UPI0032B4FBDE
MSKYQSYKEYKDSGVEWLGEIPSHWKIATFKRVIKEHSGNGFPIELQGDESGVIPFLKVSDINGANKYSDKCNHRISKECLNKYGWNLVPKGSIVTGKIGEALRKNHRKILSEDSVIDNNCIGIEPINVTENYNFYIHKVIDFDWYVNGGAIPSISVQKYKAEIIAIPHKTEQTQIANFLDHETAKIDTLIDKQQMLIALLKEKRQAVISHAVTKGLNPDAPMKDSGVEWLGEVPEHWTILKLSAIADITRLAGYEYTEYWQSDDEGEIIAIRGQNIRFNKLVNLDDAEKITNKLSIRLKRSRLYKNDIAYPCVGTIGNAVLIHESDKYHINQNIAKLTPNEKIYPLYLTYFLNSSICLESALFLNTSDAQPSILVGNLRKVKIAFPQLAEQIKIADSISNQLFMLDNLILKAELTISLMQERRTALISAAVTGKIDVRNWKAPRVAEAETELSA